METALSQTITNSLRTDSVIMKPRCVSSSSSGSLESIAQMCVHDVAVLTTRTSTTRQLVGASCCLKSYAKISYDSTRTPNMHCNVFCQHTSIKHANHPFVYIIRYSWHTKKATM